MSPRLRGRRVLLRAVLVVLAGAAGLASAEAVHRANVYGADGFSFERMRSVATVGRYSALRASQIPGLRYEYKPNVVLEVAGQQVRINAHGMRDEPVALAKPPGTLRVAAVGDSFTMGFGVPRAEVWHSVLERLLPERVGRPVEFLNLGVNGYSLPDYAVVLEHKALRFDPDLVVVGLCQNDQVVELAEDVAFRGSTRTPGFWRLHALDEIRSEWGRGGPPPDPKEAGREFPWSGTASADADAPFVHHWFTRLRDVCADAGVPVLFVYLNFESTEYTLTARDQFAAAAAELDLDLIDLTPSFEGLDLEPLVLLPNDAHPNALANRRFARELVAPLAERLAPAR